MAVNWDELDWGSPSDFEEPAPERDESLDLSELDFEHYIWLCFYDEVIIAIGDAKGFWDWWEEEQDYYTPEELLKKLLSEDQTAKIPRDLTGYTAVDPI